MKKLLFGTAIAVTAFALQVSPAAAEITQCTEITTIPVVIAQQGVYCFKKNLGTSSYSGKMIEIVTNNVTIDMNGYKMGGMAAGPSTQAVGIYAYERKNITIRNGTIRGFYKGIEITGTVANASVSSGHLIEDMSLDGITAWALYVRGSGLRVLNNQVTNTGNSNYTNAARGIFIDSGRGVVITGNLVSGVEETFSATGIAIVATEQADIHGNSVFGVNGGSTAYGIMASQSQRINVSSNRVMTNTGIGTGILSYSWSLVFCTGNTVSGYNTNISSCHVTAGNFTD